MDTLGRIARESNAAVWVNGHSRKSDGAYRDSSVIGAGVDAFFEMHLGKQESERILHGKGRYGNSKFAVSLEGNEYVLGGPRTLRDRVLSHVGKNPGVTQRGLIESLACNSGSLGPVLDELIEECEIHNAGTPARHAYVVTNSAVDSCGS